MGKIENGPTSAVQKTCVDFMKDKDDHNHVGVGRSGVTIEKGRSAKQISKECLKGCDDLPADIASIKGSKKRFKAAWGHLSNMSPDDHE